MFSLDFSAGGTLFLGALGVWSYAGKRPCESFGYTPLSQEHHLKIAPFSQHVVARHTCLTVTQQSRTEEVQPNIFQLRASRPLLFMCSACVAAFEYTGRRAS